MPLHHLGDVNHELDQRRSATILCLATPSSSPGGIHDVSRWTPESKTFQVREEGRLRPGVSAKDIILALIARIGVGGATGGAIRALNMEERMTVCNMSIEGGARAVLVAPDDTTFQYLAGRSRRTRRAGWGRSTRGGNAPPVGQDSILRRVCNPPAVSAVSATMYLWLWTSNKENAKASLSWT